MSATSPTGRSQIGQRTFRHGRWTPDKKSSEACDLLGAKARGIKSVPFVNIPKDLQRELEALGYVQD